MIRFVAFFTLLALMGCSGRESTPTAPTPRPGDMTSRADMQEMSDQSAMPDMMAQPDLDSPADMTADLAEEMTPAAAVTLTLWPRDWGLLGQAPDASLARAVTLEAKDNAYTTSLLWPAGVWSARLESEGRTWLIPSTKLTGLGREGDALLESGDLGQAAPIFSAVDEPVTISLSWGAAAKAVSITRARAPSAPIPLGQRAQSAPTTSVGAHFDDAIYKINMGQGDEFELTRQLLERLHEADLGPVPSSQGLLFIVPGAPNEPAPEVRGSFTGWNPDERARMRPIAGRLYGRFISVSEGYHEYKVVFNDGAAWFTDLGNRHIKWDGINTNSTGGFNSVLRPELRPANQGRMVWWPEVSSSELSNAREVYIHLPPGYDEAPARRYPTLYVHDGNESIVRSQLHEIADAWSAGDKAIILAFVALPTQNVRIAEYTMGTADARGDQYARFIAQTLVPKVDAQLRTQAQAKARGLVGASLGGLISYWIAINYPSIFEYTAGMSSSFWWEDDLIIKDLELRGCQGLRYYLDSGSPADNSVSTRLMRDLLMRLGCTVRHLEEPGGQHDWSYWRGRFPGVLDTFHEGYTTP